MALNLDKARMDSMAKVDYGDSPDKPNAKDNREIFILDAQTRTEIKRIYNILMIEINLLKQRMATAEQNITVIFQDLSGVHETLLDLQDQINDLKNT